MYKICSQFLIVLSCVMLMVVSLQVDYVMIACILTGIIVCTFIDMQDVPQMSPANKSKTADRAFDLILAVYILSGLFLAPSFFMLPYAAMVFRKEKYTVSRIAAAVVGIAVFVDCILRIKINQISRKPINKGKSRVYTGKDGDFTTNLLLFKSLAIMNM